MRKFGLGMLALAALTLLVPAAWAQRPGRGGPGGGAFGADSMGLLRQDSVREELKLTDDQAAKVDAKLESLRGSFAELRDLSPEERRERFEETRNANEAAVAEILDEAQQARLKEIRLQLQGPQALADDEVAAAIGLSDEQKTQLREIRTQSREAMQELFQSGNREQAREKFQALRKATDEKLMAVLNADQQSKWKALTGQPFEGEIRAPQFDRSNRPNARRGTGRGDQTQNARIPESLILAAIVGAAEGTVQFAVNDDDAADRRDGDKGKADKDKTDKDKGDKKRRGDAQRGDHPRRKPSHADRGHGDRRQRGDHDKKEGDKQGHDKKSHDKKACDKKGCDKKDGDKKEGDKHRGHHRHHDAHHRGGDRTHGGHEHAHHGPGGPDSDARHARHRGPGGPGPQARHDGPRARHQGAGGPGGPHFAAGGDDHARRMRHAMFMHAMQQRHRHQGGQEGHGDRPHGPPHGMGGMPHGSMGGPSLMMSAKISQLERKIDVLLREVSQLRKQLADDDGEDDDNE